MSELIKWSGSKDSQSDKITEYFPKNINTYYEPFVGGGSVFLKLLEHEDIKIKRYVISDINNELIEIYKLIQNNPDKIISKYNEHHKIFNSSDIEQRKIYFMNVRDLFNKNHLPEDFYFIMRTTTNGMPRYNRDGNFNNSCHFSRPGMNPKDVEKIIKKYNKLFNENDITFLCSDYKDLKVENENDFIYLDPPYENTKGMYFGGFKNDIFIEWLNNLDCKYALSYDGKVNDEKVEHVSPNYVRHFYLTSGNSSFRRVIGNSNDSIVSESLYLNY